MGQLMSSCKANTTSQDSEIYTGKVEIRETDIHDMKGKSGNNNACFEEKSIQEDRGMIK